MQELAEQSTRARSSKRFSIRVAIRWEYRRLAIGIEITW